MFVSGPFLQFPKIESLTRTSTRLGGFFGLLVYGCFFVLFYFVLNFLYLCIIIPEPAWAISYFTLFRTEVHYCCIKVLCQLFLHQQRHPNFMANLFLCLYL